MKKTVLFSIGAACIMLLSTTLHAQQFDNSNKLSDNETTTSKSKSLGLGFKAGYNYNNVTNASAINAGAANGFHVGAFFSPGGFQEKPPVIGYRSEVIFSKQGYDFATQKATGTVNLNYLILPQLTTINITKFVQLQVGGQIAFLLNAKADSTKAGMDMSNPYASISNLYNKIDYGVAGGIEIHPAKGLLIGARYNISLNNVYKNGTGSQVQLPSPAFIPKSADLKNNMLQVFLGYCF